MHCIVDLLHVAPLAIIAIIYGFGFIKSIKMNVFVLVISIMGMMFGSVFHATHSALIFDPCYAYMLFSVLPVVRIVRSIKSRKRV